MSDPYFIPGTTVMVNKLGLVDADALARAEYLHSQLGAERIFAGEITVPTTFDGDHFRAVHRALLGKVYPWAGEYRTHTIMKDVTVFAQPAHIALYLEDAHEQIRAIRWEGMKASSFANALTDIYPYWNQAHPFREGNGRTTRVIAEQLANKAGYHLDFERFLRSPNMPEAWMQACALSSPDRGAYRPQPSDQLRQIFQLITKPLGAPIGSRTGRAAHQALFPHAVIDATRPGPSAAPRIPVRPPHEQGGLER